MAKKHTKKYTRSASSAVRPVQPAGETVQEARAVRTPRRAIEDSEFKPDYTPIIRDLKRIGILAGSFFVVLLVLSFIL